MPAIRPSRLAQVALPVRDLDRAKSFYGDTLGLDHLFDAPPGLAFFRCGETRLMLSRTDAAAATDRTMLYYAVPSAREAMAALAAQGVRIEEKARCIAQVDGRDVWLGFLFDSEGNPVGVMSEEEAD